MATTMVKKVNVIAPIPIRTVYPPIHGTLNGVGMTPSNILKCLIGRATVYEILSDGSTLKLDMKNYNTVNKPAVKYKSSTNIAVQKSAIDSTETKTKKFILSDKIDISDEVSIKEEKTSVAIPEEYIINETKDIEIRESKCDNEDSNNIEYDDPELAAIAAEIEEMERLESETNI